MRNNLLFGSLLLVISSSLLAAQQLSLASPEEFAGRWETSDGHGGMIGMHIIVSTHVDDTPLSLIGHEQYLDQMEIGFYRRERSGVEAPALSFFSISANGGATWDGQHLRVLVPRAGDLPKVEGSLSWDESKKQWHGRYTRGKFSRLVMLKRPESARANSFVGTWVDTEGPMNNCLHIARQSDGGLAAWSDDISIPGRLRYAKGIQPPVQSNEHYGEIAKADLISPGLILVELRAHRATCCSHPFKAAVSSDGSKLVGNWLPGPNQVPRPVEWKKLRGNSCIAAVDESPWP